MAVYRQMHTKIWQDAKFEELNPKAKLLFIYSWTNTYRNEVCLYELTKRKIANETGLLMTEVDEILKELIDAEIIVYDYENNYIWVKNAIKYQTINPNGMQAILKNLHETDSFLVKECVKYYREAFETYIEQWNMPWTWDDNGLPIPCQRVTKGLPNPSETHGQGLPYKGKGKGKGINKDKRDYSMEIEKFRQRYSPEQLIVVDQYFDILRTTRVSGKIADSVMFKIYEEMHKYPTVVVEYACSTVINHPDHHSKKENYFFGILRNTKADEAVRKLRDYDTRAHPKDDDNLDDIFHGRKVL